MKSVQAPSNGEGINELIGTKLMWDVYDSHWRCKTYTYTIVRVANGYVRLKSHNYKGVLKIKIGSFISKMKRGTIYFSQY